MGSKTKKVKYIQKLKFKVIKIFIAWLWKYSAAIFADFGVFLGCSLINDVIGTVQVNASLSASIVVFWPSWLVRWSARPRTVT